MIKLEDTKILSKTLKSKDGDKTMFYKIIYVHNYIFVTFCVIACKFILLSEMACAGFEKLRDHAVEHLPGGEFANPTPHVVKAANTIGEATNDRIESMFGMLDR